MRPVIELTGEIDITNAERLRNRLDQACRRYAGEEVILDLSGLLFMDSTGLGLLVRALRNMRSTGGELRLTGARPGIARVLEITGLNQVFREVRAERASESTQAS